MADRPETEISEEILKLLCDKTAQDDETTRAKITEILNRDKPKCNKCGIIILQANRWRNIQVKIHWGYESTGKDTDCDIWNLCSSCTEDFRTRYFPICSSCRRTIPEVMAKLDATNPHHLYYGDYPAALRRASGTDHCGLEYAEIDGRILCEECYEQYISHFSVPLVEGSYGIWDGELQIGEGQQRQNRLQRALEYPLTIKDSISTHYGAWLPWEQLVQAKNAPNRHEKITHLSYSADPPELLARIRESDPDWQPKVYAQTADNQFYYIPITWLQNKAKLFSQLAMLDPTKLAVSNAGQLLHFGEFTLSTSILISEGSMFLNARD